MRLQHLFSWFTAAAAVIGLSACTELFAQQSHSTPPAKRRPPQPNNPSLPGWWANERLAVEVAFPPVRVPIKPPRELAGLHEYKNTETPGFMKRVKMVDCQILTVQSVLRHISAKTGVSLLAEGLFARSSIMVPNSGVEARVLMVSMARALRGTWHEEPDRLVLVRIKNYLPDILMTAEARDRERAANIRKLATSLTSEQWSKLGRVGSLGLEELTRDQKLLVRRNIKLDFLDPERGRDRAPIEAGISLGIEETIHLRLSGKGREARFGIACTGADGQLYYPSTPFYHPNTGEPIWGIQPPR